MRIARSRRSGGFTIVEVLVVVTIIIILAGTSFSTYASSQRQHALQRDAALVVSVYREAQSMSLSSKKGSSYGVHAQSTKVVRFQGPTYIVGSGSNVEELLSPYISITSIALTGGTADVVFSKTAGTTTASGTITLAITAEPTKTKVITIYGTGLVEITN